MLARIAKEAFGKAKVAELDPEGCVGADEDILSGRSVFSVLFIMIGFRRKMRMGCFCSTSAVSGFDWKLASFAVF